MSNRHQPTHEHEREHDHSSDHHFHERVYKQLTHFEEIAIMKFNELIQANQSVKDQLNKAEQEIIAKVATLQEKIDELVEAASTADLPQEVVDSLTEVQVAAQSLDDLNADETPVG
jgi:ABC-type Zn2+ transport system substrate-binding protein/surface adhesin